MPASCFPFVKVIVISTNGTALKNAITGRLSHLKMGKDVFFLVGNVMAFKVLYRPLILPSSALDNGLGRCDEPPALVGLLDGGSF